MYGKTENVATNESAAATAIPGTSIGSVTRQVRCHQLAPSVRAARSSAGSMPEA